MAFRQPYRSPLRALAEGLLREASIKRDYQMIETQLKQQQQQALASEVSNLASNLAGLRQQTVAREQAQADEARRLQEQDARDQGNFTRGVAQSQYQQAQGDVAALIARGAPQHEIDSAKAATAEFGRFMTTPVTQMPGAYQDLMSTRVPTRAPFEGGEVMRTASPDAFGPQRPGAPPAPPLFDANRTVSAQLTHGAGTAQALLRREGFQDSMVQHAFQVATRLDVTNPGSVTALAGAVKGLDSLPAADRAAIQPYLDTALQQVFSDPTAVQLYQNALRTSDANTLSAELNPVLAQNQDARADSADARAERADQREDERHDAWRVANPLQLEQLQRSLDDASAERVTRAASTGNLAALTTEDERRALARAWNTPVSNLENMAREVGERNVRADQIEVERGEQALRLGKQSLKLGEQTYEMNEVAMDRDSYRYAREQFMNDLQDETTMATGILSAAANGDIATMAFYMTAMDNPESALGAQMRALNLTPEELADYAAQALEVYELDQRALEADLGYRETTLQRANLALANDRVLLPLEREALAVQFELDAARSRRMMHNLAFDDTINRTMALGQLADAMPPAYWDNMPEGIRVALDELGLTENELRARSEFGQWLRESPMREQGRDLLNFLTKAPPTNDAARVEMLAGVNSAMDMMGIDDPRARTSFMRGIEGIWHIQDEDMRLRMLSLSLQGARGQADGFDIGDAQKYINTWNTAHLSARRATEDFILQDLTGSGCVTIANLGLITGDMPAQLTDWSTGSADAGPWKGTSCGVLQEKYQGLRATEEAYRNAQDQWARAFGVALPPVDGESAPDPVSRGNQGAPAPSGSGSRSTPEASSAPLEYGGQSFQPQHRALVKEAADRLLAGDTEAYSALYSDLRGHGYSEAAADAAVQWFVDNSRER